MGKTGQNLKDQICPDLLTKNLQNLYVSSLASGLKVIYVKNLKNKILCSFTALAICYPKIKKFQNIPVVKWSKNTSLLEFQLKNSGYNDGVGVLDAELPNHNN